MINEINNKIIYAIKCYHKTMKPFSKKEKEKKLTFFEIKEKGLNVNLFA